jgi:tight adherence protein B
LDRLLKQSNTQYNFGVFVLFTAALAITGYFGSIIITSNYIVSSVVGISFAVIPLLYLKRKKKKRMDKFQSQLPDGLELIARALRAGHAFTSGMKLAADEFDDPLGPEFEETLEEINFGVSVPDALKNLASRIDCPDLRYFVVSVILQRETGGNLSEIIESIAHIIRERYKLRGKIRVLSAEGRLSAVVLIAIPMCLVLVLRFINPEYIAPLYSEPEGRLIAGAALFMMVVGIFIIKRMIAIKV